MRVLVAIMAAAIVLLTPLARAQAPAAGSSSPLFAALFRAGPKWDAAKPAGEQALFREHSANLARLRAAGTIVMGARYGDVGLVVVPAESAEQARRLFDGDPSIAAGTFALDVQRFSVFYPGYVGTPPAK